MIKDMVYPAQLNTQSFGRLRVHVTDLNKGPVAGARIRVSFSGDPGNAIEELATDAVGQTDSVELTAPPIDYSMEPSAEQPYSQYTLLIEAPGYEPVEIAGTEVLPDVTAEQEVELLPLVEQPTDTAEQFVIPPHTLYGDYPPKIAEDEVKPLNESGEIVLSEVVIPEFIVVHNGPPTDSSAKDYYVPYADYIKNVASSEIYATWPEATIMANVLAIQSFTLNRVYTEWYRNKGYNFTITTSTAYDHKWIPERNYFEPISRAVDALFPNYLARPGVQQPILTQYCDGNKVQCPNWMTQWGSKYLGDQGYTPIEILRYFYGDNMYIGTSHIVSGIPSSWPGSELSNGSGGESVRQIQNQLNAISNNYPLIPKLAVDGVYGPLTENAVKVFQKVFKLPQTGVVDFPTWYKISGIYVAVSRIAELM